jgi:hypothetical protein
LEKVQEPRKMSQDIHLLELPEGISLAGSEKLGSIETDAGLRMSYLVVLQATNLTPSKAEKLSDAAFQDFMKNWTGSEIMGQKYLSLSEIIAALRSVYREEFSRSEVQFISTTDGQESQSFPPSTPASSTEERWGKNIVGKTILIR